MNAISEIAILLRNGKSVRQSAESNGLPITRIETIADGTINPAKAGFADLEESDCTDWLLQDGDILISHINSTKHLGKCAIYQGDPPALIHGMNLLALRVDPDVAASRYVYWMLSSTGFRRKLPRITKDSVNQSSFNISRYKKLEIPVPPLADQKRIAGILDAADALRAKSREALAQLDTLTQSIFLDMFGDPATNPKGFERSTIGLVSERVTDGEHLTPKRTTEGIKLLSARNIRDGYIDFENVDYISAAEYERIRKRCDPSRGDILISCSGTIGRVASVDTTEPFSLVRSAAMVRPKRSHLRTKFLAHYLRTPDLRAQMLRRANASSQANLFQGQIRELPVLLPPLSQQDNFVVHVACLETLKAAHSAFLKEVETLFASLQARAFRGDL